VDVRVVAATNSPLEQGVKAGTFRKDLFYRLQVVQLDIAPLRNRPEDIAPIAEHFVKRYAREFGRKLKGFTPAAMDKLAGHPWPGNVRELRNVIERAVALSTGAVIDAADLWLGSATPPKLLPSAGNYEALSLDEVEKRHIILTLTHTDWNKSKAAELLGIERSTLDRKIKGYGLSR
jgi:Nif-specific regulatory protein